MQNKYYYADLGQATFIVNEVQKLMPDVKVKLEKYRVDTSRYYSNIDSKDFTRDFREEVEIECIVFYKNIELGTFRKYISQSEHSLEDFLKEIKEVLNRDYSHYSNITLGSLVYLKITYSTCVLTPVKVIDIVKAYEWQESGLFALLEDTEGCQTIAPVNSLYTLEKK